MLDNRSNHIPILSSLRFFAAFSVCLYHFVCTTTGFVTDENVLSFFNNGKYGVQMFFVISGFVIPWSMYNAGYKLKNIFRFLLKRFLRLEPPYLVSVVLAIIIILLRQNILNNYDVQFSSTQIILHFGYLIPFFNNYHWLNQIYWTLAIEFQYYLLIALLFPLFISPNKIYRYILYIVFIALGLISNPDFLPFWLPVFLMGIILFLTIKNKINKIEFYLLLIVLSIWSVYLYGIICCCYSLITVFSILYFNSKEFKITNFLGEMSYSVYLIHPLIGGTLINVLSHSITVAWQKILLIVLGVIITFLSAWIMYLFVEKPSKRWSAGIKY